MKFIGITGGIGAGKSEILRFIGAHYSCRIYLADEVAHLVKEPGTQAYDALISLLGTDILMPDAEGIRKSGAPIDKKAMAACIFADADKLEAVNQIIHPAVKTYLLQQLDEAKRAGDVELFFVEAALLIETGYKQLVDEMWYIYASEDVRRERLAANRGYSDEKITAIMSSQMQEEAFRAACDFVIDNSGKLENAQNQIRTRLEGYTWQA